MRARAAEHADVDTTREEALALAYHEHGANARIERDPEERILELLQQIVSQRIRRRVVDFQHDDLAQPFEPDEIKGQLTHGCRLYPPAAGCCRLMGSLCTAAGGRSS